MTAVVVEEPGRARLSVADDYLSLGVIQRYGIMSQPFPAWLKAEPIVFRKHHPTYAWACLVEGCNSMLRDSHPGLLCALHFRAYKRVKDALSIDDFVRDAKPVGGHGIMGT